ncbi:unnamed protein product, partial [Ectocarpus sp. 12 AP-2014]
RGFFCKARGDGCPRQGRRCCCRWRWYLHRTRARRHLATVSSLVEQWRDDLWSGHPGREHGLPEGNWRVYGAPTPTNDRLGRGFCCERAAADGRVKKRGSSRNHGGTPQRGVLGRVARERLP